MKCLNRPVLISNLVSGAIWLVVLGFLTHPVMSLIGAAYVVVASLFLAAFCARASYTKGQELAVWVTPWLGAVLLWAWVFSLMDDGISSSVGAYFTLLYAGLLTATPCYLAWQLLALAIRRHPSLKLDAPQSGRS